MKAFLEYCNCGGYSYNNKDAKYELNMDASKLADYVVATGIKLKVTKKFGKHLESTAKDKSVGETSYWMW